MNEETILRHVALQYKDREQAEIFFTKILGLPLKKTFNLSKELTKDIFGIEEDVLVDVYDNGKTCFEIFITNKSTKYVYEHTCIEIRNKEEFIKRCGKNNIEPMSVKKGEKILLFVKDYAGNLFEVKEKT